MRWCRDGDFCVTFASCISSGREVQTNGQKKMMWQVREEVNEARRSTTQTAIIRTSFSPVIRHCRPNYTLHHGLCLFGWCTWRQAHGSVPRHQHQPVRSMSAAQVGITTSPLQTAVINLSAPLYVDDHSICVRQIWLMFIIWRQSCRAP